MLQGLLALVLAFYAFSAQADLTVVDHSSGRTYFCDDGGGMGNDNNPAAGSSCVRTLSDYCYQATSMDRDSCFDMISKQSKCQNSEFSQCVKETTEYCFSSTSKDQSTCFNLALGTCGGNLQKIRMLNESVKSNAIKVIEAKLKGVSKKKGPSVKDI
jgi:hypothetical protein